MMNWGSKKQPSSSSSRPSSISRVFPMLWLSRFKKMDGSSESKPANAKRKGKKNSPSPSSPSRASWNEGRVYGWDNDFYWRLSFGEERTEGEKSRTGLKSVRYDSDDELDVPMSSSQSFKLRAVKVAGREESRKFDNVVADRIQMRESPRRVEILQRIDAAKGRRESGEAEVKIKRSKSSKDQKSRKTNRRVLEEKQEELAREADKAKESSTKSVEKDIFEQEPVRIIRTTEKGYGKSIASDSRRQRSVSFPNSNLWTIEEDCVLETLKIEQTNAFSEEESSSEWQKLKDMKINELMLKNGKLEKSVYSKESKRSRRKHNSRVGVCSPRTAAKIECKIKAFEDMKKAKMKAKKTIKKRAVKEATAFDSFAVVKSSIDPHQDFKDSMVEMITEKGIRRPEELEELLACYLTLNCDEYHDLIIKVFRQVWYDLNQVRVDQELQTEHCFND